MMSRTIKYLFVLTTIVIAFLQCGEGHPAPVSRSHADTTAPVVILRDFADDTAYMFTRYMDPGVSVLEGADKETVFPVDPSTVVVSGSVDTRLPGTYELVYEAFDRSGNKSASVKRRVHVVEHRGAYLAGNYSVACTCTATAKSGAATFYTTNYSTTLQPTAIRDHAELTLLSTGGENVAPRLILQPENRLDVFFYSPNLHTASRGSGTLTPAAGSFTLETTAYQYDPDMTFACTQIFSRKLKSVSQRRDATVRVK